MRDEGVRGPCFGQLAILCAEFGDDVPYAGGLDRKFAFRGRRVPYLANQKGLYRAAVQRLLEDEDGPMLELLKGFHGARIVLPRNATPRPDRQRLASRFERFVRAA